MINVREGKNWDRQKFRKFVNDNVFSCFKVQTVYIMLLEHVKLSYSFA